MKIFVFLIMLTFLFMFIFIKSNTLENRIGRENKGGIEYVVTKQSLHWDRFFNYIKDLPGKIMKKLPQKNLLKVQ